MLTVPASFDAVARELTVEAARSAGFEHVTLIEEPQAAFYAWLEASGDSWRTSVKVDDLVLVCDVGGGTTDLTLIGVADKGGDLELTRLAVGEHILLGGDNMDLALAYAVASTLPGGVETLDPIQRVGLSHACRSAKEMLFSHPGKASAPVSVLGRGSKVIGGSIKTALERETLQKVLLDGFFPACSLDERPSRARRSGFAEIGLPYANDPAITRHIAAFLSRQNRSPTGTGGPARPTAILFNGGVFQAEELRAKVHEVVGGWTGVELVQLESRDLNIAVARGAAYYGLVRSGKGVRIRGGVSRSYYIGVESPAPAVPGVAAPIKALCVAPLGTEEGTDLEVPGPNFGLVVGEPAEFRFLSSTVRRDDPLGSLLERWQPDELSELAPLVAELPVAEGHQSGQTVPVRLHCRVTEIGTLELWCGEVRGDGKWKLEFNVRHHE